jgi:hypothetical protein
MDYKSSRFEKQSIVDLGDFELRGYGGLSIKLPLERRVPQGYLQKHSKQSLAE